MIQPRGAARDADRERDHGPDGDLAELVRKWMAAGAPVPDRTPPGGLLPEMSGSVSIDEVDDVAERALPPELPEPVQALLDQGSTSPRQPSLPHRPTADEAEHATRLAVLIDARRVSEEVASGLLAHVGERGAVNVCRAYADWSRTDLGTWVARLRRQGLHSFHQFADDDDQALVAMAIDAVDIARDAAIDEMVIAGDMTSMLPLVHRLHSSGVRVVLVGPRHTAHDVRAACDEFLDEDAVGAALPVPVGRHRA